MSSRLLRFGKESLEVYFDPKRLAGSFEGPSAQPGTVADKVRAGLAEPLEAPPFARAFAPGDRVAIALDGDLERPVAILEPILAELATVSVAPSDVTVLTAGAITGEEAASTLAGFTESNRPGKFLVHDPGDEAVVSYLASTKDGRRIYLSRELADADATFPVTLAGFDPILGFRGGAGGVFPAMSNGDAHHRSRGSALEGARDPESMRLRQICEEVGWLLGAFYSVNVALDRDGEVDRVWIGKMDAVQKAGDEYCRQHWTLDAAVEPVDLVVAAVAPRKSHRTDWPAFANALHAASRFAPDGCPILLLTDIEEPLGPTGGWLADADNHWEILARLRESREPDVVSTAFIVKALAKHKVYLYSRLQAEVVESLTMVHVSSAKEVQKLVSAHKKVMRIEQADRVFVRVPRKSIPREQ